MIGRQVATADHCSIALQSANYRVALASSVSVCLINYRAEQLARAQLLHGRLSARTVSLLLHYLHGPSITQVTIDTI